MQNYFTLSLVSQACTLCAKRKRLLWQLHGTICRLHCLSNADHLIESISYIHEF